MPTDRSPRKLRVDQALVDRGLVESRARAQALVLAGLVFCGETKIAKPGQTIAADAALEVRGRDHPWVSRGGIKLAHAIDISRWTPRASPRWTSAPPPGALPMCC
jgi:23S rRNA (cytidine1920-2'-O)/16S rRNA (cytidine1409-2'-O)-methyltransferase